MLPCWNSTLNVRQAPLATPSVQVGTWQTPAMQTPLSQSELKSQPLRSGQPGQPPPPQSVSVSLPFCTPSGGTQLDAWQQVAQTWNTWFLRRPSGKRGDMVDQQWAEAIGEQKIFRIEDEQRRPGSDPLTVATLKRQKLHLKDEITRLAPDYH